MTGKTNSMFLAEEEHVNTVNLLKSVICSQDTVLSSQKDLELYMTGLSSISNSFYNSRFKSIKITGTTGIISCYNSFKNNPYLTSIILGDDLSKCTSYVSTFDTLPSLENVSLPVGTTKADIGFPNSSGITRASLTNIIASLYDYRTNGDTSTTRTITLHESTKALLTNEERITIPAKGWTIA